MTWRRVKTPHMTTTEHLNITNQILIENEFTASVNIVKISILIVSRQRHSSWNRLHAAALNALEVLKLYVTALRENVCGRELNESFKLIHEPIHWFANCFDQAFEQYLLKIINYLWMDITHYPEKRHVLNKLKHL